MKAGYRKFYKYFSILVFMGCGYLMLNFWEEGKGQISSYNMQDKALMILWFMIYTFGTAAGIINTLTSIYIYEWGMQISAALRSSSPNVMSCNKNRFFR